MDFLNICWKYGCVPEEWNIAIVIPIKKKGDRSNYNYLAINLICAIYKVYVKCLARKL
jgi:hypothetical protein